MAKGFMNMFRDPNQGGSYGMEWSAERKKAITKDNKAIGFNPLKGEMNQSNESGFGGFNNYLRSLVS